MLGAKFAGAWLARVAALATVVTGAGCGALEATTQATAPRPVRPPTEQEIALSPCKYGDLDRCIDHCLNAEPGSCNAVGVLYEYGGSAGDAARAAAFYARACTADYAPGCSNLGWLYALGRGVERSPQESIALFTRAYDVSKIACRHGDASACLLAGELLEQGRTVGADDGDALAFFDRACAGGEAKGCQNAERLR